MNYENDLEVEALLAAHLNALLASERTDSYLKGATGEELELLHLANRLNRSLMSVEPNMEFVAALKAQFVGTDQKTLVLRWKAIPARYRLAARLGGGALTAGLALFAGRRALGRITGQRSRPEPAAAVVETTPSNLLS